MMVRNGASSSPSIIMFHECMWWVSGRVWLHHHVAHVMPRLAPCVHPLRRCQDIGIGAGKHYSVNFPLRDGIDDQSYESIFKPVRRTATPTEHHSVFETVFEYFCMTNCSDFPQFLV